MHLQALTSTPMVLILLNSFSAPIDTAPHKSLNIDGLKLCKITLKALLKGCIYIGMLQFQQYVSYPNQSQNSQEMSLKTSLALHYSQP